MFLLCLALLISLSPASSLAGSRDPTALPTRYSTLVADSFITRGVKKDATYASAVFYRGVAMLYNATGNATYLDWVDSQVSAVVSASGAIAGYPSYPFSLDDVQIGTVLLDLYEVRGAAKYKAAAQTLRRQLDQGGVRNGEGGFWHRKPTYPDQMWLDGVFMADVFYGMWTAAFDAGNGTAWDDVLLQYGLVEGHCRNQTSHLLKHGYDESKVASWADPGTGASPLVWDRAMGWYMMALVDLLDVFPVSHPGRTKLVGWFTTAASGVLAAQDVATGGWWLVMDEQFRGEAKNYIESSASSMFVYALLKGVRKGYLGYEYVAPMKKGYEYLAKTYVKPTGTGGTVNWEGTVEVGSLGSSASYDYYTSVPVDENDLKGAGPFIYASVEYEQL